MLFPCCVWADWTSTALLPPVSTWHKSFQSRQMQLHCPGVKSVFVHQVPSVQHYNFSGFNNSNRSPQCPVAALHCETPFWQIQVSGWWAYPIELGMSVPQWADLKNPLGQTPTKSRTERWCQLQKLKTWKSNQTARPPYSPGGVIFGEKTPQCCSRGGLHDFKRFPSQCHSSLLIKTKWHSSFTYMELWN